MSLKRTCTRYIGACRKQEPLTFLAGIYGMNFKVIPEPEWRFGYPSLILAMIITLEMLYFFRKRNGYREAITYLAI